MSSAIQVRPETESDAAAIDEVHRFAFGRADEASLVTALRDHGLARVSLVAESTLRIIGHVMFSEIRIECDGRMIPSLSLAPLAVRPEYQRNGCGSSLVQDGLRRARELGHESVFVLGSPIYYSRFGFSSALARPFECIYACESFQAVELQTGSLTSIRGKVHYSAPFAAF